MNQTQHRKSMPKTVDFVKHKTVQLMLFPYCVYLYSFGRIDTQNILVINRANHTDCHRFTWFVASRCAECEWSLISLQQFIYENSIARRKRKKFTSWQFQYQTNMCSLAEWLIKSHCSALYCNIFGVFISHRATSRISVRRTSQRNSFSHTNTVRISIFLLYVFFSILHLDKLWKKTYFNSW